MLPWEVVNAELLRQENKTLQKKYTLVSSQLRSAEQRQVELQVQSAQLEHSRKTNSDDADRSKADLMLRQLQSECADFGEFLANSRAIDRSGFDRVAELIDDNKRRIVVANQLSAQRAEMESDLKACRVELVESTARLAEEVQRRTTESARVAELTDKVRDLEDESRHARAQCAALKRQLQEERENSRLLELERRDTARHRSTAAATEGPVDSRRSTTLAEEPAPPAPCFALPDSAVLHSTADTPETVLPAVPRQPGVCPLCAETAYGLMVRCGGCEWSFHAACARKQRATCSGGDPVGRFQCAACRGSKGGEGV